MRIAFLFFAEAYQTYHGAAVAFELMRRPGVTVDIFYNMPDTARHLERLARAHDVTPCDLVPLHRGRWARFVQKLRIFGLAKAQVLRGNEKRLESYDAVVAMEDGAEILFGDRAEGDRPARILIVHGAGDRMVPSMPRRRRFDLLLCQGPKMAHRFLDMGVARAGHVAAPGYPKFDSSRLLSGDVRSLFQEQRPIILYNPHKVPRLGSWPRFIEPMLSAFARQDQFNLIVAPHVKMFLRSSERLRRRWRARSSGDILIDPGSDRSVDNSYTDAADIYVGDVSSQVYEFLARPRPCVFLNAAGIDWRDDRHFLFWHLGDVVDDPAELMTAIRAAPSRHHLYIDRQRELAAQSLGDTSPGAAARAANLILDYLAKGRVPL